MGDSPHAASIHILDDDSILNVFHIYRSSILCEDEDEDARLVGGNSPWVSEHWWYKLAHVCQRWRNLILGSASYLGLCLVCTKGTPVADMLAHSPSLPLVIDHLDEYHNIAAEDEEGTILALKQRHRVRRVRLQMPVADLQRLIVSIDEEYPILEYLLIMHRDNSTALIFSETFQASNLRYLALVGFTLPVGSRLLTTATGLVTLYLVMEHPSTYFQPITLFRWLSLMPQLEMLAILFFSVVPSFDVETQLAHTPTMAPVTLPNLHRFRFLGVSAYLDALVHRITAPRLETLEIYFLDQRTFSVPCLLRLMETTET
jgi:hypothetical protein